MVRQARCTTTNRNPNFTEMARSSGEGNLAWGERAAIEMRADAGPDAWTYIALLGGSDTLVVSSCGSRSRICDATCCPPIGRRPS